MDPPKAALRKGGGAGHRGLSPLVFTAIIKMRGINPYIFVCAARANAVKPGWRKALPVLLRINAQPSTAWRVNRMPAGGGEFYLYLHGAIRKESKTGAGDRVGVGIAFDADYKNGPQHPMPLWFKRALPGNPRAEKTGTRSPPAAKKEILRDFSRLRSRAAQARNLAQALHVLSGETGRSMARMWGNGS